MKVVDEQPLFETPRPTGIRCGKCKGTHPTIAEVRACFGKVQEPAATQPQINYCQALLRDREPPEDIKDLTEDRINAFSKREASDFINKMKAQPFRRKESWDLPHPEVPEGYYALRGEGDVIDFFKVVDGRDHRILYQVYGSPGSLEKRAIRRKELATPVMDRIAEDPESASLLFGMELGVCGRCGSPLTSDWRKLGIGPDCSKKGWG